MLIITVPNIGSYCSKRFKGNYRLLGDNHVVMYSPETLTRLLETSSFKVIKKEYPYFRTDYFTIGNLLKLLSRKKVSPPFYGNLMTLYSQK